MSAVLEALIKRTEGRAELVGRFGAWYSQCLICGLDSGPWFTRIVAASSGLLHLDGHHADTRPEAGQQPLPIEEPR